MTYGGAFCALDSEDEEHRQSRHKHGQCERATATNPVHSIRRNDVSCGLKMFKDEWANQNDGHETNEFSHNAHQAGWPAQ